MNDQQRRLIAIWIPWLLVRHWPRVGLGIVCAVVAFTVNLAPEPPTDVPDQLGIKESPWAQAVQAAQSFLDDRRADPFTGLQAQAQNPAMQSVAAYLRAHQVDRQPIWAQVIARMRYSLGRH